MLKVFDIEYTLPNGKTKKESKLFDSKDDIIEFIKENNFTLKKYKINYLKTIFHYILKILMPKKSKIHLKDKELLVLIKLLRNMARYRQDEAKMQMLFENYGKNDKRYKSLKNVLNKLSMALSYGINLDKALEQIGVPKYITKSIKVGNESGKAEEVYSKLIDLIQVKIQTQRKISKMLLMPKITILFLYAYFLLLMFYIVPKTKYLLSSLSPNEHLPALTQTLFNLSTKANAHPFLFVTESFFLLILTYKLIYLFFSKITKYIPKVKDVFKAEDFTLLSALLSVSLAARIQLHEAISFAAEAVNDQKLKLKLFEIADKVGNKGQKFSQALKTVGFDRGNYYEKDFYNLVFAMEETGELNKAFEELTQEYKERLEDSIEIATTFINPLVLIFIAGALITLYGAINAPLFKMNIH